MVSRKNPVSDRVLFLWLFAVGWVGVLAGMPFTFALMEDPAFVGSLDRKSIWLRAIFEAMVQLAPASAVGIWLGKRVHLGPRLPEALAAKKTLDRVWSILVFPAFIGLALGIPIMFGEIAAADRIYRFELHILTPMEWLLRSLSAAITEEIGFRLGLMTLFVWVLRSIVRKPEFDQTSLWIGNLLSALVFGAGHLPGTAGMLMTVLVLNTVAGLLMGWLYLSRGLLAAMVAHFVADAIRVIPLLSSAN